jgi:S1-C subfamily serine protease
LKTELTGPRFGSDWLSAVIVMICAGILAAPLLLLLYSLGCRAFNGPEGVEAPELVACERRTLTVRLGLPDGLPAPVQAAANHTVPILIVFHDLQRAGQGSGFVHGDRTVITAAHLTAGQNHDSLSFFVWCNHEWTRGDILHRHEVRDVMVLRADCQAPRLPTDQLAEAVNTSLYISGFNFKPESATMPRPIAERFVRHTERVPFAELKDDHVALRHRPILSWRITERGRQGLPALPALAGALRPGNSGSPVFDDDGRLVGMFIIFDHIYNRSYIVPVTDITYALQKAGLD